MNPDRLLQHFDQIAEAPDAMHRLRRFVLELAVRGKVVEQNPDDEPAPKLLKQVETLKLQLLEDGMTKKTKSLPPIEPTETAFSLPKSWVWCRLQDITSYIQRGKSPKYAINDGSPVISQKCVQWQGLDLDVARLITEESLEKYEPIRFLQDNDLLWNSTGTGTIGRVIRITNPKEKLVCDSHVTVVRCAVVNAEYVRTWLRSDHVYQSIEDRAAGSTNQVELTAKLATSQIVPLPPLREQNRIVAKVEELMELCNSLKATQHQRDTGRGRLLEAILHEVL